MQIDRKTLCSYQRMLTNWWARNRRSSTKPACSSTSASPCSKSVIVQLPCDNLQAACWEVLRCQSLDTWFVLNPGCDIVCSSAGCCTRHTCLNRGKCHTLLCNSTWIACMYGWFILKSFSTSLINICPPFLLLYFVRGRKLLMWIESCTPKVGPNFWVDILDGSRVNLTSQVFEPRQKSKQFVSLRCNEIQHGKFISHSNPSFNFTAREQKHPLHFILTF